MENTRKDNSYINSHIKNADGGQWFQRFALQLEAMFPFKSGVRDEVVEKYIVPKAVTVG